MIKTSKSLCAVLLFAISLSVYADKLVSLNETQTQALKKLVFSKKGAVDPEVIGVYTNFMLKNASEQLKISDEFWKWVNFHKDLREGLAAGRYPLDYRSIEQLAEYFAGIEKPLADKYRHLLLGATFKHQDESRLSKYKEKDIKADVQTLKSYMKSKNKSIKDVAEDQDLFKETLKLKTSWKIRNDLVERIAIELKIYPPEYKASRLESMKYLIANQEKKPFAVTPSTDLNPKKKINEADLNWPMFPLENTPWPLLVEMGAKLDLKSAEIVWDNFLKGKGIVRYSKYGSTWRQPENKFKKSDFHPGSLCRVISDGGICGRQANMCIDTNILFGIPSTNMGQPGHAAVTFYGFDKNSKKFYSSRKQSITGSKDSICRWSIGVPGGIRYRKDKKFVGIEYYVGLALSVNNGIDSYNRSRVALHLTRAIDDLSQAQKEKILESALNQNPWNTEVVYSLAETYGANLAKVNSLVGKLRQMSADGEIDFETVKGADTDFAKIEAPEVKKGDIVGGNARDWVLLVTFNILLHNYSLDSLDKKALQEGYSFLSKEVAYQEKIRRSPYLNDIKGLIDTVEIRKDGVAGVQKELLTEVITQVKKMKKVNDKTVKSLLDRIKGPLEYIKDNKEKADYLSVFRKGFPQDKQLIITKKTGAVSLNPLYSQIFKEELRYLKRSGRANKDAAKALDQSYKDYLAKAKK